MRICQLIVKSDAAPPQSRPCPGRSDLSCDRGTPRGMQNDGGNQKEVCRALRATRRISAAKQKGDREVPARCGRKMGGLQCATLDRADHAQRRRGAAYIRVSKRGSQNVGRGGVAENSARSGGRGAMTVSL